MFHHKEYKKKIENIHQPTNIFFNLQLNCI